MKGYTRWVIAMARALALFVIAYVQVPVFAQQERLPTNGNDLLNACSVVVDIADKHGADPAFTASNPLQQVSLISWCTGYLDGVQEMLFKNNLALAMVSAGGVTFDLNSKTAKRDDARPIVLKEFRDACIPDQVPLLQLARVLVKWLREHPERLHEPKMTLTLAAFQAAFPCPPIPMETAKPVPPNH